MNGNSGILQRVEGKRRRRTFIHPSRAERRFRQAGWPVPGQVVDIVPRQGRAHRSVEWWDREMSATAGLGGFGLPPVLMSWRACRGPIKASRWRWMMSDEDGWNGGKTLRKLYLESIFGVGLGRLFVRRGGVKFAPTKKKLRARTDSRDWCVPMFDWPDGRLALYLDAKV
ncbi:hypothetical protein BJ508DRAFT_381710 [Ascobolus immersus RN42]|uniref:Uncharacterized protein n=1 Tax=Ascobolus immersus RN42 TaxID=1160509 RepID=A0A3N4HEW5_ASCIM|nr:hypothetical protein BJ508DRAFT_381710 [Ascobolus immersus RN42]